MVEVMPDVELARCAGASAIRAARCREVGAAVGVQPLGEAVIPPDARELHNNLRARHDIHLVSDLTIFTSCLLFDNTTTTSVPLCAWGTATHVREVAHEKATLR